MFEASGVEAKRVTYLAPTIIVLWIGACAFGHFTDVRLAIAITAIGLAVACLTLLPDFFRRLFRPSTASVGIGLVAAIVMIAATYFLYPIISHVVPQVGTSTQSLYGLMRVPHATPLILFIVALIVIGEEILWRGVVQQAVETRSRTIWAVPISALVYGLSHAPIGSPLLTAVAVACGLYWSILRNRTNSLLPSLIAHLLWDMAILTHPLARL